MALLIMTKISKDKRQVSISWLAVPAIMPTRSGHFISAVKKWLLAVLLTYAQSKQEVEGSPDGTDKADEFDISVGDADQIFINPFSCNINPVNWEKLQVCYPLLLFMPLSRASITTV